MQGLPGDWNTAQNSLVPGPGPGWGAQQAQRKSGAETVQGQRAALGGTPEDTGAHVVCGGVMGAPGGRLCPGGPWGALAVAVAAPGEVGKDSYAREAFGLVAETPGPWAPDGRPWEAPGACEEFRAPGLGWAFGE